MLQIQSDISMNKLKFTIRLCSRFDKIMSNFVSLSYNKLYLRVLKKKN